MFVNMVMSAGRAVKREPVDLSDLEGHNAVR